MLLKQIEQITIQTHIYTKYHISDITTKYGIMIYSIMSINFEKKQNINYLTSNILTIF